MDTTVGLIVTGGGVSTVGLVVGDTGVGSRVVDRNERWKSSQVTGWRMYQNISGRWSSGQSSSAHPLVDGKRTDTALKLVYTTP